MSPEWWLSPPPPTAPGAAAIADLVEAVGAECVIASRPPADMRASVELGLAHLATSDPPTSILLSPGDCPGTRPNLVARLIEEGASHPARIIVPRHGARTGHPILIPWSLAARIPGLPPGVGVNHLLACHPDRVHHLAADPTVLVDLDTPEDWQAWIANHPSG